MQFNIKKIVFLQCFLLCLGFYSSTALAWWDCTWAKRVPVTIANGSLVALTNYEIQLTVNAANFPGYVFANASNDFRAVDTNDITLLSSFVEPRALASASTTAWVKIPSLAAGASKTIYIYYAKSGAANVSDAVNTFSQAGIRIWTRNSTASPTSRATAEAAFAAGTDTAGYGCKIITSWTNISNTNQFTGGVNSNIAFSFLGFFNASTTGNWGFRNGPDYGRGGGMYIDDQIVQERWTNMYWAGSYATASQILANASVSLSPIGYHVMRDYGFEDCCDGVQEGQFKTPSGAYTIWTTTNLTTRAPQCPANNVTVAINPVNANNPVFSFSKTVTPFSDPVNNTINPKYIPGGRARYTMGISNQGGGSADSNSIILSDAIPLNAKLYVGDLGASGSGPVLFTQGSPSSTLVYTFAGLASTTDSVSFSNNNGATYTYTPVADANGFDVSVTNLQINAQGAFACTPTGTPTGASFQFDAGIK